MEKISIVISGSGSMGREVFTATQSAEDIEALAYLVPLSELNELDGLPVYQDAPSCFAKEQPQVVIDFTNAAWTPTLATEALQRNIRLVIGTTGHTEAFLTHLETDSREKGVGVVLAPNFAIGAVLLMSFAKQAAKHFDAAEIIELHHNEKVDAPSGTAKKTAEQMADARGSAFERTSTENQTIANTRGGEINGVGLHSIRLPGLVAHQEIIFGGLGQTLTLRHDSTGRDSFMPGVLAATYAVISLDKMVTGLESILGLE